MHLGRTTLFEIPDPAAAPEPPASTNWPPCWSTWPPRLKAISAMVGRGALGPSDTAASIAAATSGGRQCVRRRPEAAGPADQRRDPALLRVGGLLAGMASEEMDDVYPIPDRFERVATCWSTTRWTAPPTSTSTARSARSSRARAPWRDRPAGRDFLQPGTTQVAAGYAIYGPSTMLVLTVGKGTHGFTLDREIGNFILTHRNSACPRRPRSSRSTCPTSDSGSRRSRATWPSARPGAPACAAATSTCAGSPPWWPTCTGS